MAILDRLRRVWTVFSNNELVVTNNDLGPSSSRRTDRTYGRSYVNDKSIVTSVYNRIALDVSGVLIKHITLDEKGRYKADATSKMNDCFTLESNLDQAPSAFRQDIAMTLFDKGSAAIVPIIHDRDMLGLQITDVSLMRVGDIVQYYSKHVRISVWDQDQGKRREITLPKRFVAIVENPLAAVMNEPNSTMQRLIAKLGLLDTVDGALSSGKLDIIIQLPYVVKSEARKQQANQRREDIELQLTGSKYGIAYADATEKITQLNRPAENNLLKQVEYLVEMLYGQLGITPDVMNGTADESAMINYHERTIYPIVKAIVEAMRRSFLGKDGIRRKEDIRYFREPFKFVPLSQIAEIVDKFKRNEVMTTNEIRNALGLPPSEEETADKLANPNMPQPTSPPSTSGVQNSERNSQNES